MAKTEKKELEIYKVVPEAPRIRALIYGEPGCGKTTLAASAQDHDQMAPVLFGNIEGGTLSIAHRKDIYAVDLSSTDELYELFYSLKRKKGLFAEVETLVLDNITELQTLNLDEIVQAAMESGKDKDKNRESEDEIWQEDYGVSTMQLGRILRWFKNLDINLILTAHAKFVYPGTSGKRNRTPELAQIDPTAVLPMITQKLMKTTMGLVDFVWFLMYDPDADKRLMLTRPDGIYQAKTRGPLFQKALGRVVTDPTMPQLYDTFVKSSSKKPSSKEK